MTNRDGETPAQVAIARSFVEARLGAKLLSTYPGVPPANLDVGYAIQNAAIALWPDEIAGWKVGRIGRGAEREFGCDRLAGPIFRRSILAPAKGGATPFPVFVGGFAAVEAEFIFVIGKDAPPTKTEWSRDEAKAMVGTVLAGVEIAGSPFAGINDYGPAVTISDFGNNGGLILGPELSGWRAFDFENWKCKAHIGARHAGANDASSIPGGPLESFRFLLEHCASRGIPARKGWRVSTGAVTGVHAIEPGETARLVFIGCCTIDCIAVPAAPAAVSRTRARLAAGT